MKKLIAFLEYTGGGLLFVVMVLITASAASRYLLNSPLRDSDDIARLLLLPAIFFGLAGACHHGEHIQVDLLWENLGDRGKAWLEAFATLVMMVCVGAMAYGSVWRVFDIQASRVGTYELRLPLWPFFALASLGLILSAVVLARKLAALAARPAPSEHQAP